MASSLPTSGGAAANGRFTAATALRRRVDLGSHVGMGGSSCPYLLRHREVEVPEGKVVRLLAGTVCQFRHLELQRRLATRPR
jgi:hypothetical protein